MSRKDYIVIAAALREAMMYARGNQSGVRLAGVHIAEALKRDNPRFDSRRFLEAAFQGLFHA